MVDTKSKLATEIKDLKSKLTESTRQLAVEKNKYQLHRTSVKTHRTTANAALEQRNVALDKLKAVEQERDRWEDKYASVHCYWLSCKCRYHNFHVRYQGGKKCSKLPTASQGDGGS